MGPCMDFLHLLEPDMSIKVLTCLDDPTDLVRISSVSRAWRHFVIENGFCKKLCLRMFPQLSRVSQVVELNMPDAKEFAEVGSSNSKEMEILESEHRVYAFLAHGFISFKDRNPVKEAISASSTDNDPEESINHTLVEAERLEGRPSYWSSKGQSDPEVPETLTYKLVSDLVVITEITLRPFKAYFQVGYPIYSANAVRFRMGHLKSPVDVGESCLDDEFIWTYTSQVFPMTQDNCSQTFKFPEPVLCIGGILQIELLGRVQRQEMDGLFYICVSHVKVKGKPVPQFSVDIHEQSGEFVLKNDVQAKYSSQQNPEEDESDAISAGHAERHIMLPVEELWNENELDVEGYWEGYWHEAEEEIDEEFVV